MVPRAWQFRAPLRPALRRGALAGIPVAGAALVDLELDLAAAGAVATGALLAGFVAFDAPARTRLGWLVASAPLIGASGALGGLAGDPAALAVAAMALFTLAVGLASGASPRAFVLGLNCILAFLIAQDLVAPDDALHVLGLGTLGALLQALTAAVELLWAPVGEWPRIASGARQAGRAIGSGLSLSSTSTRHSLRLAVTLAVAVASYHLVDLGEHGFWVPLTVLFVLRPERDETFERVAMRAAGTLLGLVLGTPIAEAIDQFPVAEAVVLGAAAAFAFALLRIEYALFTTAITFYVVVLAHGLGQPAWEAADERAIATALGISLAAFAFFAWGQRRAKEALANDRAL
jgi:fusaric acid resistance family protein